MVCVWGRGERCNSSDGEGRWCAGACRCVGEGEELVCGHVAQYEVDMWWWSRKRRRRRGERKRELCNKDTLASPDGVMHIDVQNDRKGEAKK